MPRPKPCEHARLPVGGGTPTRKDETTNSSSDPGPGAVKERHSHVDSRDRGDLGEFDSTATFHEDDVARRHLIAKIPRNVSARGSQVPSLAQLAQDAVEER